jgi:YgiT-type zinc finger domain-containing protein
MVCRVCQGEQKARVTDLPFKIGDSAIVIVKGLPVWQCGQCGEIELDHQIMVKVDELLNSIDKSAELEVIRYAA